MSRSRNIKPGFFKNDLLAELPFEWRILFQGLWCEADRSGRLEDRPKKIKAEVFPYDHLDVDAGLSALQAKGFIVRYEVDGLRCIEVVNFAKHQNPHKKEALSVLPGVESGQAREIPVQAPETPERARLIPDSLNLIPERKEKATVAPAVRLPARFDDFWAVYPNKQGKQKAAERWTRDKLDGMADSIIAHVVHMAAHDDGWRRGYAPMGSTYLNQARWTDEARPAPLAASQQPGKQLQGLMALEDMKHGLVPNRDHHGHSKIGLPGTGAPAFGGSAAGYGVGLAGGAGQRLALGSGRGFAEDSRGVLDLGPDSYCLAESAEDA